MGDRDDLVYQAKLAEQAERYDGKTLLRARADLDVAGGSLRVSVLMLTEQR